MINAQPAIAWLKIQNRTGPHKRGRRGAAAQQTSLLDISMQAVDLPNRRKMNDELLPGR
jgi:hypothetical protein